MITAEQEYRAAYERGFAGLPYRFPWNAAHRLASRQGYDEGANDAAYQASRKLARA